MLTRSLDEIIHATTSLPAHLGVARRHFAHSPQTAQAFLRLQDALIEVEIAILGHRRPERDS
jgi:hypothetical protein